MPPSDIAIAQPSIAEILAVIENTIGRKNKKDTINGRRSHGFVYILEGSCHYTFEGGTAFEAAAGDVLYLAGGAVYHKTVTSPQYSFIYVDFTLTDDSPYQSALFHGEGVADTAKDFRHLLAAHLSHTREAKLTAMRHLYTIFEKLCAQQERRYLGGALRERMQNAKAEIERRALSGELSVTALAEEFSMSEVYFRKSFAEAFGISPKKYIVSLQIEKAKDLLTYPFLTVTDCATRCGFSTRQYFCRVFLSHTGESPTAFRRRALKQGGFQ